jgi:hypothetical protein
MFGLMGKFKPSKLLDDSFKECEILDVPEHKYAVAHGLLKQTEADGKIDVQLTPLGADGATVNKDGTYAAVLRYSGRDLEAGRAHHSKGDGDNRGGPNGPC